jgi:hypothetical protein
LVQELSFTLISQVTVSLICRYYIEIPKVFRDSNWAAERNVHYADWRKFFYPNSKIRKLLLSFGALVYLSVVYYDFCGYVDLSLVDFEIQLWNLCDNQRNNLVACYTFDLCFENYLRRQFGDIQAGVINLDGKLV